MEKRRFTDYLTSTRSDERPKKAALKDLFLLVECVEVTFSSTVVAMAGGDDWKEEETS